MLPDERVGSQPQCLRLVVAADLNDDGMRLAGNPPRRIPIDARFSQRGSRPQLLGQEFRDQIATKLRDQHAEAGLSHQRNARPRLVGERDLASGDAAARDVDGIGRPQSRGDRNGEFHRRLSPLHRGATPQVE